MNFLLSLVSGLIMWLAFPPFSLFFVIWGALVPLFVAIARSKTIKEAFLHGMLCGSFFFGGALFWINTLTQWAGAWATVGYALLVVFQALFIAAFSSLMFYILKKQKGLEVILIPVIWVAFEWLRSLGPFGVTGGGLGYSQVDFLVLAQIARLSCVYGISLLVLVVNVILFELIISGTDLLSKLNQRRTELVVVALLFVAVLSYGTVRLSQDFTRTAKVKVSVIQAAIPQDIKLDPGQVYPIVDLHEILSKKALSDRPQIIIWPETAVTTYLNLASSVQGQIVKLVRQSKAYYLIGVSHTTGSRNYNSVAAFSPDGKVVGRYNKQRPVPFGEYLPIRPLLYPILKGIDLFAEDYHSDPSGNIIDLGIAKVGVVICFESTFPALVRSRVKKGADFIVVATNDSWFGRSAALTQHLQASRMRAIENGVYVVQAANTGISAIIDPAGRILKRTNIDEEAILTGDVHLKHAK